MPLDETEPSAARMVSELSAYIRAAIAGINAVFTATTLALTGETSLTVGTELADVGHETISVTSTGASVLATILGGTSGQMKTFIFGDNNVSLTDGVQSDGKFYLEQIALSDFDGDESDILCIVNIGGDGSSENGYWKEIHRTVSVR